LDESTSIRGLSNLKNEIQIITLLNELMEHWKNFLMKHFDGELINLVSRKFYRDNKNFKLKANSLKKEFFKHGDHFTNQDFRTLTQHLLDTTPGYNA